jgi:hypothetical protein
MELLTISNAFTIFGNFTKLLNQKDELKKLFEDYHLQESQEQLPNGLQAPVLVFDKENKKVVVRVMRIDMAVGTREGENEEEVFLKHVEAVSKKLEGFLEKKSVRIAFNKVSFVENENNATVEKLNDKFNVKGIFTTPAQEFSLRVNLITSLLNEDFNCIVTLQDGSVNVNKTHEQKKAVFVNLDINSLPQNQQERFDIKDAIAQVSDMMVLGKERTNQVISKLN